MPGFIKPQLATLKAKAPQGGQWLHEIKYDGYRVQVHLNRGRKKVFTRNGLDWTKRFTEIAGALAISGEAIIDGEVGVVHQGRTNFSELQAELAAGRQGRLIYYAFDLLWRNGDLRQLPQIERKQAALYLGKQEGKDLVYMGKVGTGWSRTVSSQIRKQLDTVVSPRSKLTRAIKKPKATWVEPMFYADVEYRDITSEGLLRASSFKGLIKGTGRT